MQMYGGGTYAFVTLREEALALTGLALWTVLSLKPADRTALATCCRARGNADELKELRRDMSVEELSAMSESPPRVGIRNV